MNERYYNLIVTLDDGDQFKDGIKAESSDKALENAHWNWEYAISIELV